MIHASLRLVFATPILIAAVNVNAAEHDTADDKTVSAAEGDQQAVTDLSTVSVIGARHDARRSDTASKIVINKDELLQFGDTTLSDALKRQPGVTIRSGQPGKAGSISLRGLGNGYTQILVNGQKAPVGFDLESLAPEMVERVEIIRSATADLRTEAIAGTINIVLTQVARTDSRELKLGLGASNGQWMPSASWHQSQRDDYRSTTLNTSVARREFLVDETGTETGVDAVGEQNLHRTTALRVEGLRDTLSVAPGLNLTLENGDTVSLQGYFDASHYNKHGDIDWNTLMGAPLRHVRYHQFTGIDVVGLRTDLSWTHEFETAGKLATKLTLGGNREDFEFREQGYGIDDEQNLDDVTDADLRVHGVNSTGKYSLPSLGEHVLELGWEGSLDRRRESRQQHLRAIAGLPETISDLDFDAQIRRLAFYAQDDWTVTPHWSLYLGLRWERIETLSDGSDFKRIHHRASVLSPLLQSLWKLPGNKNDQIRLGLSRTYKSPALASMIPRPYTSTNNRPLDPDQQGNPALRPELALGLDLAYEHYWNDDGAMLSLGAYARTIDGMIRTETHLVDGRWVASPINGGDATTWGIELDSKFPLTQLIARAPAIDVRFNLTHNWSRVENVPGPDNRIGQQPSLSSTLAADYKINSKWTVGGSYTFVSGGSVRTTLFQIDNSSTRREFDLYALWSVSAASRLRLSVGQLLRQDLVTGAAYFDGNGSTETVRHRAMPWVVRANLEIKL